MDLRCTFELLLFSPGGSNQANTGGLEFGFEHNSGFRFTGANGFQVAAEKTLPRLCSKTLVAILGFAFFPFLTGVQVPFKIISQNSKTAVIEPCHNNDTKLPFSTRSGKGQGELMGPLAAFKHFLPPPSKKCCALVIPLLCSALWSPGMLTFSPPCCVLCNRYQGSRHIPTLRNSHVRF